MRDDRTYLTDILEAIERIEKYANRGRSAFDGDELIQIWIVHHIQIIGEATRKLSESLRSRRSDVPWAQIAGMRNVVVHDYFRVDLDEVWLTAERDIPALKVVIDEILKSYDE